MNLKSRLRRSIIAVFLLVLVIRITTTLPLLRTLTEAGLSEPAAKAISQVPTVLFVVSITFWFGWTEDIGLQPETWWSREALWAFTPVLVPIIAIPLLGLQIAETTAILWLLMDAVFVSIWEELYFRGVMLEQVRAKLPNPRTAIIVTAGIFGAIHLTNISAIGTSPTFAAVQILFAFLSGIGMGAVRLRTGNLWPLIIAHFLIDGPERLIFGEQATTGTPTILGLMLAVGVVYAAYGWVASGRLSPNHAGGNK